jgi:hypothetical protein
MKTGAGVTDDLLRRLGYSDAQSMALRERNVVA